ncbi:MAG: inositol monophosphatase [Patescibacteria group bacterium]
MRYATFLEESLKKAGALAIKNFGKVQGTTKPNDNNQVLTQTDLQIGSFLIEQIKEYYPIYNIIDEEAGIIDNKSEYTWIIDPIDGTSNFAAGIPTYGIMLGLLKGDIPIAGGMSNPYYNQICIAEQGQGAYLNREKISVTDERKLQNCLLAYHIDGHQENPQQTRKEAELMAEIILRIRNLRTSGSEPIDALYVASGNYGGLLNQTMKIWDVVAPQIIIQEAGGQYTDFLGKAIDYSNPVSKTSSNFTCCAAAPALHSQIQEIIKNTNMPNTQRN